MALSLSINYDESEPWDRYMALDLEDADALAEWERWFERYLRARRKRRRDRRGFVKQG